MHLAWFATCIGLGLPKGNTLPMACLASAELPRSFRGASADLPYRFVFWPAARAGYQGMSHHCWIGMLKENHTYFRFHVFTSAGPYAELPPSFRKLPRLQFNQLV